MCDEMKKDATYKSKCTHGIIKEVKTNSLGKLYGAAGAYLKSVDLNNIDVYVPLAEIAHKDINNKITIVFDWPMVDYGCWDLHTLASRAEQLANMVHAGQNVCVACHGGHGRTGTLLSAIVMFLGEVRAQNNPVKYIRRIYCQEAVESSIQEETLNTLAQKIRSMRIKN